MRAGAGLVTALAAGALLLSACGPAVGGAGAIDTPMLQRAMAKRSNGEPPNNHARRIGIPYDVGYLAAFLCSEESGFITATVQTVDGGVAQH